VILFVDSFTNLLEEATEDTAYHADILSFKEDDGTNIFRVLFYSVPAIMSLVFRKYIYISDDPFINVCVNLSIVAAGFYVISFFTSGIIIGRIPIYFSLTNYILIPWLAKEVFNKESSFVIQGIFVVVYAAFFYYQVGITWGRL
jgi:transmembrane protein EpsG